jgi:hypothetical protein
VPHPSTVHTSGGFANGAKHPRLTGVRTGVVEPAHATVVGGAGVGALAEGIRQHEVQPPYEGCSGYQSYLRAAAETLPIPVQILKVSRQTHFERVIGLPDRFKGRYGVPGLGAWVPADVAIDALTGNQMLTNKLTA